MEEIRFVIDENGNKVAVVVDLEFYRSKWQYLHEIVVYLRRRREQRRDSTEVHRRLGFRAKRRPAYKILYCSSAARELKALSDSARDSVLERIRTLADSSRSRSVAVLVHEFEGVGALRKTYTRDGWYRVLFLVPNKKNELHVFSVRRKHDEFE